MKRWEQAVALLAWQEDGRLENPIRIGERWSRWALKLFSIFCLGFRREWELLWQFEIKILETNIYLPFIYFELFWKEKWDKHWEMANISFRKGSMSRDELKQILFDWWVNQENQIKFNSLFNMEPILCPLLCRIVVPRE